MSPFRYKTEMRFATFLSVLIFTLASVVAQGSGASKFEFKDGDRVVFLGDTMLEREQQHGYIETVLTASLRGKKVIFRNLAWSADSVLGESRASFDPPEKGFERLKEQLQAIKPTVAILGYGMAESFQGQTGLGKFKRDINTLLDAIAEISKPEAVRFLIATPLMHETLPAPLPNPDAHNAQLRLYTEALREIAGARNARLIDLFKLTEGYYKTAPNRALTDNGIHPSASGFREIANFVGRELGISDNRQGAQLEALRETIVKKNELFFHRWRPQNQTYLFGFRKYEQGQNAKEIPMFDPLISEQEEVIFRLTALEAAPVQVPPTKAEAKGSAELDLTPLPHPSFDVAPELEVTLWAENPNLAKPIHMNFDPQGRLWVASSSVYPQIEPGKEANDKILILEDTDRDGKADKTTVFADGLLIPTGVEPGDGGAYVANSTELLFYKDHNGDGQADEKRVMLSGFGTEDTHHILHSLRWGHDGQLYMNQSIYIHSHIETPHGVVRLDSGGILNLRPPTQELGIHMKGLINSWGHHFDQYGQSFATDGAGHEGINWVIPQAMYVTYEGARRVLHGVSPGNYPKFCGLEVIESEHFPEDWQGTLVTCDFRAHRIVRFQLTDQDAGYTTKELPDVMRTTNVTFRPIDVKVGPDGALYIADWSNPIIQHGEVDFRDPRRDHEHGRIWRVTYKGRALLKPADLTSASNASLLKNLLSKNGHVRQQSRRILTERGEAKIKTDLESWTKDQNREQAQLEALWMWQSIDVAHPDLLKKLLSAGDGRIRAAATRVLSFWRNRVEDPLTLIGERIADEHPRVRVEAVRAAAKIPSARSAELVLGALEKPVDRFLDYAIWLSINDLAEPWVKAVQAGQWKWEGREKQLEFALKAIEPVPAAVVLSKVLSEKPLPKDGSGPWIDLIAKAGSREHLAALYGQVLAGEFLPAAQVSTLNALAEAARLRQAAPGTGQDRIIALFREPNREVGAAAVRLAGQWKVRPAIAELLTLAEDLAIPTQLRTAIFQSLREIGGAEAISGLSALAQKNNGATARDASLPVRIEISKALTALEPSKGVPVAIAVLTELKEEEAALNLWRALLSNKSAAAEFTQALPKSGLPAPVVRAGLRAAREGGRNEPNLVLALARNIDEQSEASNLSPQELERLLAFIKEKGDPARGEAIYRRAELGCVSCHAIGGVGGKVGPDLTSIGASAPPDYLVESMLFPDRKVKEGYHAILLETRDEMELSGILVRETDEQLFLRDASNREVAVAKNNIAQRRIGGSIMPAGLIDTLTEQEQGDLYRFLSELGKPGSYDASKGNVARLWQIIPRTLDVAQFPDSKVIAMEKTTTISHNEWQPLMTLVDGRLPKAELEKVLKKVHYRDPDAIYAKTRFEVANSGPVRLQMPQLQNAIVWVDGQPVEAKSEIVVNLASGPHTIAVKLSAKSLPEHLSAATSDGTFIHH